MKKLIISAIISVNLFASQCVEMSNKLNPMISYQIELLGNKKDIAFCENYSSLMLFLTNAKNICEKQNIDLFEPINKIYNEFNKLEYRQKCNIFK